MIYEAIILFQYLKTVVAMQDSTLSETGSQFIFLRWIPPMWEQEVDFYKTYGFFLVLTGAGVLDFYWEGEAKEWGCIKKLCNSLFNQHVKYLFCL